MGEARRVVNGYVDGDGYEVRILDDGSAWRFRRQAWRQENPPLPPEALGEVGEFEVGDEVLIDGDVGTTVKCTVCHLYPNGNAMVTWEWNNGSRDWDIFELLRLTKVPR